MNKQTAVEWLMDKLPHSIESWYSKQIEQAKEMEKQHKKNMLMDIDTDLALIEDCAKGELGNKITELRTKIDKLLNL
jgi:hypothetical protein